MGSGSIGDLVKLGSLTNKLPDLGLGDLARSMLSLVYHHMFWSASQFNYLIAQWDTSSARDMKSMSRNASEFNQPVGQWDTSSVTGLHYMFWLPCSSMGPSATGTPPAWRT